MKNGSFYKGVVILSNYLDENDYNLHAEHDILFYGPSDPETVSAEDRKELEELGWFIYDNTGWACWT